MPKIQLVVPDRGLVGIVRSRIPLWLSLSMLFSWTANTLFPIDKAPVFAIGDHGFTLPYWALALAFFVLVFFTIGLVARQFSFNFRGRRVLILAALLMSGSLVAEGLIGASSSTLNVPFSMLSLILLGAATPILYIETIRQFMRLGFKVMLVCTAVATVFTNVICYVLNFIPAPYPVLIVALFPLVLTGCLIIPLGKTMVEEPVPHKIDSPALVPWRLLVTSLFQGIAFGLLFFYVQRFIDADSIVPLHLLTMFAGFIFAAFSLLFFAMVFNFDFNLLIYKIGFSLLAFGAFLVTVEQTALLGIFLGATGYRLVDLLIFTLVVYLAGAKDVSLNWLVAWPTCMLYLGLSTSYVITQIASPLFLGAPPRILLAFIALIVVFLAVILASERNIPGAWGFVRLTDRELIAHPHRSQIIRDLEQRFELSNRQGEVLRLLVAGQMYKEIARELNISDQTVKVHARAVYQKLSVHSHKELMLLISRKETHLL
jgi:DNA-binding CsgD family transcriptional regulator